MPLSLSLLGTGVMRIVNIGLLVILAGALIFGAYKAFTGHYVDIGRGQVTTEVQKKNEALDNKVQVTNEKIIHDVTHETQVIEHNSKEVEYVVQKAPVEPISNVTKQRLNVVYEQQRPVREASQGSN